RARPRSRRVGSAAADRRGAQRAHRQRPPGSVGRPAVAQERSGSTRGLGGVMKIAGATALVTGANRGFGRALTAELIERGALVYAGGRNPDQVDVPGAKAIALDITDAESVSAAAAT